MPASLGEASLQADRRPRTIEQPSRIPDALEFRARAGALARTRGRPRAHGARDLGIHPETLRRWIKQAALDAGQSDGLTATAETTELARMRREARVVRDERETRIKTARFVALESGP